MDSKRSTLAIKIGFELRFYDRADVRNWVDAQIVARDSLDGPLLDLATLGELSDKDILSCLGRLIEMTTPTPADRADAVRMELAILGKWVATREMGLWPAIQKAMTIACGDELDDQEKLGLYRLEDDFQAAEDRGELQGIRTKFLEFTGKYDHLIAL